MTREISKLRAVVSGGTGFVGRHVVRRLNDEGYAVTIVSRNANRDAAGGAPQVISTNQPPEALIDAVRDAEPTVIVHLAALGHAETPASEIGALVRSNIELGTLLLEAAAGSDPVPFVATGSFWQRKVSSGETHPNSLYAATKDALEAIARYFCAERGVRATFLQLSDVYGSTDERGRLLPALAEAAISKRLLEVSGGEQQVSFVHVDDVSSAILHTIRAMEAELKPCSHPAAYSVHGPNVGSLRQTVSDLSRSIDLEIPVSWGARPYRSNEVMIADLLDWPPGWSPRVELAVGFTEILESLP